MFVNTLVVNLFGSSGVGKSTGAAYIFSHLKLLGLNVELVTEFAKDLVWEENKEAFKNQAYLFGNQYYRLGKVCGKVDIVVTDSPLLLSILYNNDKNLSSSFDTVVLETFNSFNNLNFLLNRVKKYNPVGRIHTEDESRNLEKPLVDLLKKNNVKYKTVDGNIDGYNKIIEQIINMELDNLQ